MDQERDLVVFEDDGGNEITMEVIDYFFYEGQEYAVLADYTEDDECAECESEDCENCEAQEVVIMKVVPVGDDEEEFVPVDEQLATTLVELLQSGAFDDEDEDDDDDFDDDIDDDDIDEDDEDENEDDDEDESDE